MRDNFKIWIVTAVFGACAPLVNAQWQTQSFDLEPGWNGIYLHVDSDHVPISVLAADTQVEEVWQWQTQASTAQFVTKPDAPSDAKTRWASWSVDLGASSTLQRMPGNYAYLVKLGGEADFTWEIKGQPEPTHYSWTITGLNFIGVPAVQEAPVSLDDYFSRAGDLLSLSEVFAYGPGALGEDNPAQVFGLRTAKASRGSAFWMRSGTKFNRYFGPFDLKLQSMDGVHFGDKLSAYRVRLRNHTSTDLTVTLAGLDSEEAPSGQTAITDAAPVIIRGALDTETLTYEHVALSDEAQSWTLKPLGEVGSELELVLGLDRSQMTGNPGALYASILRFTDSIGHSQLDIPVSGTVGSSAGLWIGEVSISQVRDTMKAEDPEGTTDQDGKIRSINTDAETFGEVASPYPLRLILHQEHIGGIKASAGSEQGEGVTVGIESLKRPLYSGEEIGFSGGGKLILTENAAVNSTELTGNLTVADILVDGTGSRDRLKLLQRVYVGILDGDVPGIGIREDLLKEGSLGNATRISCIHLPVSEENTPWFCAGIIEHGETLSVTVQINENDHGSNPFLHTYHPDHDNLTADFDGVQSVGSESYKIKREIKLTFGSSEAGFSGLSQGGQQITGSYEETLTLSGEAPNEKSVAMKGVFNMNRISDIDTLTVE
jgi:hypothetical protein